MRCIKAAIQPGRQFNASLMMGQDMMDFKHTTQVFPYLRCAIFPTMLTSPQIPGRVCKDPDQARPGQAEGTTPIIAPAQTSDGVKVVYGSVHPPHIRMMTLKQTGKVWITKVGNAVLKNARLQVMIFLLTLQVVGGF